MTPLNVVTDCKGCGHCCEGLGTPPFEGYDDDGNPWDLNDGFEDLRLPSEAVALIHEAHEKGYKIGDPCCWFDGGTRTCRFYDHRPDSCMRFDRGNPFCLEILEFHGLTAEEE